MLVKIVTFIFIIFLITRVLFSTKFINNRWSSDFKTLYTKTMLTWDLSGFYKMFNPSITKYKDGYVMCTRYNNKTIKNLFMYAHSEIDYQSYICFVVLSLDMKIKKIVFPSLKKIPLEDPRITFFDGYFFVSVTELISKKEIYPTLYIFDEQFNFLRRVDYNRKDYFITNPKSSIQKNWCPFPYNNEILLHTDTFPDWKVYRIDHWGDMHMMAHCDSRKFFRRISQRLIRCSTSWKSFSKNTFICGIHTKQFFSVLPTIRSVLVEIDKRALLPIRHTEVFCVDAKDNTRVQFLSGLEVDELNVYLTFGIGDYRADVKRVPKSYIRELLAKNE